VFFAIFGSLLAAGLSGCGGTLVTTSSGVNTTSPLTAPSSVDFGTVAVGQATSSNVTLVNQTSTAINVSQLSITGNPFLIAGQNNFPITITPNGGSYTVPLQFVPKTQGTATGQLTVTTSSPISGAVSVVPANSSNSNSLRIALHGNAHGSSGSGSAALSSLTCSLASITGAGTDACTVTLSAAAGSGGLTVSMSSNNSAVSVPASVTVPAGATAVGFSATIAADTTAQAVTLTATAGGVNQTFTINLGAYVPALTLSTTSLNFGDVTVNTTATKAVTLTSSGTAPLYISANTLTGSGFSMSGISSPLTLNPGQTATVAISLNPTTTGTETGTLTLTDNTSPSTAAISLSGTGQAAQPVAITISPTQAILELGSKQQFTATVSNTTNQSVTWYVNGTQNGNATYGTIDSSGMYTTPTSIPSGGTASVSAVSVADTSKSAVASVSLLATTSTVSISISPTSSTLQGNLTQQFAATVSGTTNTAVNWLVNGVPGGNSTNGTISSAGVYTAPPCPAGSTATVTAQSAYDTSVSASAVVSLAPAPLNSTDRYVATNGSDGNDGSACHPWATLQKASSAAQPGWIIHIMPGTYPQSAALSTSNSGVASAPITFVGADYNLATRSWPVKIVLTGADSTVWSITGAYVTIEGIDLSSNYSGTYNGIKSSAAYTVVKNSHIHNIVNDGQGACVVGGTGSDYYTVINNEINNCGTSIGTTAGKLIHGIYLHGYYSTIENNLIYRAAGTGIQLYSYGVNHPNQEPWHSIITSNTIFYCGKGITASADQNGYADYNFIGNNIVAFLVDVDTPSYGIYNTGANYGTHNTITNNLVWSVPDARYIGTGLTYTNDVNADPQFVNYQNDGSGDYHLGAASAAIDAGTSQNAPSIDFEGTVRPQGNAPDIGAYEFH